MKLLEKVLAVVAPHSCLVCGQEGWLLCPWCRSECLPVPERCYRCKAATSMSEVCKKCRRSSNLRHMWVATEYDGAAKLLIHALKFERAQAAARDIAAITAVCLPYLPPETIVTHIPTATSRLRQRGYDQAQLIAEHIAHEKNVPYVPLLARMGQTRQVRSKKVDRERQLRDAYRPIRPVAISGAKILLIDDVVTTGASLEAAARALRRAGVKSVDACTFAQKQ